MASYLIYIPKVRGSNPQHLVACGLSSLLADGAPLMSDVLHGGPDGGEGVLCVWDNPINTDSNPRPGVQLDCQTWKKSPEGGYWIGWETARPVRPEDVERRKVYQGCGVTLNDGNSWHVPVARQLPHILGIGPPRIDDPYKPFFDKARANLEAWLSISEDSRPQWTVTWQDAFPFCCEALALNYRLCPAVVDCLRLIRSDVLLPIVEAITDGWWLPHAFELIQKKTKAAEDTTASDNDTTISDSGAPA